MLPIAPLSKLYTIDCIIINNQNANAGNVIHMKEALWERNIKTFAFMLHTSPFHIMHGSVNQVAFFASTSCSKYNYSWTRTRV